MGARQPAYEPPDPSRIVRPGLAGCSKSVLLWLMKDYEQRAAKLTAVYTADIKALHAAIAETKAEIASR